jgi:uncharacterized protein with von Willebrand factor type A (vWA) domain
MLLEGDAVGLNQAMERPRRRARSTDVRLNTQRNLLSRRMLDEMGLRELEELIQRLREMGLPRDEGAGGPAGRAPRGAVRGGQPLRRPPDALYASETGRQLRETLLGQAKLTAVEPEDMRQMEALVKRMAKRLATRYARKRHRADKGKLDVRKTIRKSMGYGGVPFDIVWKTETIEKPKIVAICDVSRSVAAAAQFMLLFLYSLNEVIEKLEAFAFSDRLIRVGDILDDEEVDAPSPASSRRSACAHRLWPRPGRLLRAAPRARSPHHGDHPGRRPLQLRQSPARHHARDRTGRGR